MQREITVARAKLAPEALTSELSSASATLSNLRDMLDIVLRRAVSTVASDRSLSAGLHESMVRLCSLAHKRGVRAEQLLVMIKDAWSALPEAKRALKDHSDEVLSRVITLCIDEFYAGGSPR